jgi:hypothetical protein
MQPWSIPLVVATAAFLAVLLWRVRPVVLGGERKAARDALRSAHARVAAARDDAERAAALCDAAELVVGKIGGPARAAALYQRAMRAAPSSAEIVERAAKTLVLRPRALEGLLWRRLAASPWDAASAASIRAALDALRALYEGPLKNAVRARAIANAREGVAGLPRSGA